MEINMQLFIIILYSYIIGSLSPSLMIGKVFFQTDIRKFGSKNLGGSNAGRILGKKIGIVVILLDLFKGFVAVWISAIVTNNNFYYVILSGLFVILGHIFPMFAKLRGGKGVATTGGVLLYIQPVLLLISLVVLITFWIIAKYESLSTLLTFTFLFIIVLMKGHFFVDLIATITYLGILYAHRLNIKALINRTEKKKNLLSKFE